MTSQLEREQGSPGMESLIKETSEAATAKKLGAGGAEAPGRQVGTKRPCANWGGGGVGTQV